MLKLTENCKYEQNSFQLSRSLESYFLKSECNHNDIVLITVLRLVIINRDLFLVLSNNIVAISDRRLTGEGKVCVCN